MYFWIFVQQLIASGTHIIVKDLTETIQPSLILLLRAFFAAGFYILWVIVREKKYLRIEKKDIPIAIILGIINIPINQYLFFLGVRLSTAPNAGLAYALTPAFVLIIALLFLKESRNWMKISGVVIAIGGAVLIMSERGIDLKSDYFLGNVLLLLASFSWALYTILGRDFSRKYGAVYSTAVTMVIGFISYIPIYLITNEPIAIGTFNAFDWLGILYLGIMTSGVGYLIWFWALKKMEASKLAVFNNLQPILTTILAMIFHHHVLTMPFLAGGVLIIGGVILAQRE
ncbi:MAG: EamA family transporter [Ignavibacteriae bacterium]|nr:EamA family transporter [Ignavibacteriota bacterium]